MSASQPRSTVRFTRPTDGEALRHMFVQLSTRTIYLRFHTPYPAVPAWAGRLFLDAGTGVSLVAVEDERIIGHAMYVPWEDGREAEVGILIVDERQSRGVGRLLLSRLAHEARMRGIGPFTAEILGENRRALDLFSSVLPDARYAAVSGPFLLRAPLGAAYAAA